MTPEELLTEQAAAALMKVVPQIATPESKTKSFAIVWMDHNGKATFCTFAQVMELAFMEKVLGNHIQKLLNGEIPQQGAPNANSDNGNGSGGSSGRSGLTVV